MTEKEKLQDIIYRSWLHEHISDISSDELFKKIHHDIFWAMAMKRLAGAICFLVVMFFGAMILQSSTSTVDEVVGFIIRFFGMWGVLFFISRSFQPFIFSMDEKYAPLSIGFLPVKVVELLYKKYNTEPLQEGDEQ